MHLADDLVEQTGDIDGGGLDAEVAAAKADEIDEIEDQATQPEHALLGDVEEGELLVGESVVEIGGEDLEIALNHGERAS